MDSEEIKKHFGIHMDGEEPLCRQLSKRLEAFIGGADAAGTVLPSERVMAETLAISRVTVRNALEPFYKSGRLTRNGRRGTRIAPPAAGRSRQRLKEIHELALGMPFPILKTAELSLLLFENLPNQKAFWEKTVADFNQSQSEYSIRIEWLKPGIRQQELTAFIDANRIALFQWNGNDYREAGAVELPETLQKYLRGEIFCRELFESGEELNYLVPLNFTLQKTFWNESLARQYGLGDVRGRLRAGEFPVMAAEAAARVAPGHMAADHVWDYVSFYGFPENGRLDREFLAKIFRNLAYSAGMERGFGLRQRYSLDALENFLDGKQVFQNSTAPFIHLLSNRASFDMRSEPFVLEPGSVQLQGMIGMAVSRHCFCPDGAESFYRYLLSEKVQRDVGTVKEVLPFRRSAWEYAAAAEFGWTQARARDFLPTRCCPPPNSPVCRWFEFATFHIREEIYEFMTGQISRDTVIDKILTKWNQGGLR